MAARNPHSETSPLRHARLAAGMSPEELAFRAGVSMRTIERIENGEAEPRRATRKVIADALGLDLWPVEAPTGEAA